MARQALLSDLHVASDLIVNVVEASDLIVNVAERIIFDLIVVDLSYT